MNWIALPDDRAAREPDGPAIADADTSMSNAAFAQRVRSVADQLRGHGVGPGTVLAIQLRNRVELVVALFAGWRVGAAVTPVNPNLTDVETEHQLSDARAVLLIGDARPMYAPGRGYLDVADLAHGRAAGSPGAEPAPAGPDDLAVLIYTSGTTGSPKGVMLTHGNLSAMCGSAVEAFELTPADRCLLILPLFHANAIVLSVLSPLLVGASTTIVGKFVAEEFFGLIETHRSTYFSAVPTVYAMLDALDATIIPDTSTLRFAICGAAPMHAELIGRIEDRYGFALVEGYGLSEGTCASVVNPLRGPRKPGTVGLPLPGQSVDIVDESGASVPTGVVGEVMIGGPTIMAGYLNKPEETATTVVDGVLHTGDVGYFDPDGYLVLVDRIKDMIIRGGENLYPKEIETVLYHHCDVVEAAVVGRPDAVYGEVPIAFVAVRPTSQVTPDDLREFSSRSLSKFKMPVQFVIRETLPKNSVGKLDKPTLRAEMATTEVRTSGTR